MLQSPVVSAQGLTKQFPDGTVALREVSLSLAPGQLVAVLGPSGSGKTTLFRLCNGSVRPTRGTLRVLDRDMVEMRGSGLRRLRCRLAVVYQNHSLVSSLSVLHNVLIGRLGRVNLALAVKTALLPSDEDRHRVGTLLEALGIADKIDTRVDDLSGGQQQRVAVARALIQEPELLLADEPVASVDEETAIVILDLLAATCRERGTAVLVSLHQRQYVQRYADRILELSHGKLIKDIVTERRTEIGGQIARPLAVAR